MSNQVHASDYSAETPAPIFQVKMKRVLDVNVGRHRIRWGADCDYIWIESNPTCSQALHGARHRFGAVPWDVQCKGLKIKRLNPAHAKALKFELNPDELVALADEPYAEQADPVPDTEPEFVIPEEPADPEDPEESDPEPVTPKPSKSHKKGGK